MLDTINKIKTMTGGSSDFIYKELLYLKKSFYLVYNEVLSDSELINDFILRHLSDTSNMIKSVDLANYLYHYLPDGNIVETKSINEALAKLLNGYTLIVLPDEKILAIETRANLKRGIPEADSEISIRGPKDAFVEHFNTNLGLIRRRIKSEHLWMKEKEIGKQTKTKVGILYMENIAEENLVQQVSSKLDKINIDGIIDSGYLKEQLEEDTNHFFPTVMTTERPDRVAMALLEGKVAILVDTSPFVLLLPNFFIDFFHTTDDYYQKPINITFIRIIRIIAFLIAILTPAYYIAITTHNHDCLPLSLLINFTIQRENVPFPAIIEALAMSITFEILRESDTRMPANMGTAVSILGGLVLGDAAVSAGIISPIMIIVIAISAISGLIFSSIEMISAVRWWRIIMMLLATFLGIYGIFLGIVFLIGQLSSLESFGKPYLAPFAPFVLSEQKDALIRVKKKGIKKRNPLLTKKNIIRGR